MCLCADAGHYTSPPLVSTHPCHSPYWEREVTQSSSSHVFDWSFWEGFDLSGLVASTGKAVLSRWPQWSLLTVRCVTLFLWAWLDTLIPQRKQRAVLCCALSVAVSGLSCATPKGFIVSLNRHTGVIRDRHVMCTFAPLPFTKHRHCKGVGDMKTTVLEQLPAAFYLSKIASISKHLKPEASSKGFFLPTLNHIQIWLVI